MAPVRILTKVDLPAPLAPIKATISPRLILSEASRSATTAPNLFDTPLASKIGASSFGRAIIDVSCPE